MYKINFNGYLHLIDWSVIYWGIKNDIIPADSATDYANLIIKNTISENDSLLVEIFILDEVNKNNVLSLISKNFPGCLSDENISVRILRYIILDNIKQTNQNSNTLLYAIENIYADFNYPSDMNSFISYMPVEDDDYDSSVHTKEENEQRLTKKFNVFLESELQWIFESKKCAE